MKKYICVLLMCLIFNCSQPENSKFNCNDVSSRILITLVSYKFDKLTSSVDEIAKKDSINYYNRIFEKLNYSLVNMAGGASIGQKIGIANPCDKVNLNKIKIDTIKNDYINLIKYLYSSNLIGHESFESLNSLLKMYFCDTNCSFSNNIIRSITIGDFLIENLILQLNIVETTNIYNDHNKLE